MTGKTGIAKNSLKAWIWAARPKTLFAGLAPVIVGGGLAVMKGKLDWVVMGLCFAFSVLVQVACNYINDYYDHANGVDNENRVGFKRVVASGLIDKGAMRVGMLVVLGMAFMVGMILWVRSGFDMGLMVVGVVALVSSYAYTGGRYPLGYYGYGDLLVFIFFGLVGVGYTVYLQVGKVGIGGWLMGVAVGGLAVAIRVVNDLRDRETDEKAGKRTWVVRWGHRFGVWEYGLCVGLAEVALIFAVVMKELPVWSLSGVIVMPKLFLVLGKMMDKEGDKEKYNGYLVTTAKSLLIFSLLVGAGCVMGLINWG